MFDERYSLAIDGYVYDYKTAIGVKTFGAILIPVNFFSESTAGSISP